MLTNNSIGLILVMSFSTFIFHFVTGEAQIAGISIILGPMAALVAEESPYTA